MDYRIYDHIGEIDRETWDRLTAGHFFSSHRLIGVLEQAKIPGVRMFHVVFSVGAYAVAATSFYTHDFDLDLLSPPQVRKLAGLLNTLTAGILSSRILLCGLPISLGQAHLHLQGEFSRAEFWEAFHQAMNEIAQAQGVAFHGAKEFERRGLDDITKGFPAPEGFSQCHSLPTVTLPLRWNSFADYLDHLRPSYRRQAMQDLKLAKKSGIVWHNRPATEMDPRLAHRLYLNIFEQARFRFEQMTPEFFAGLAGAFPESVEWISGEVEQEIVSIGLLFHYRGTTHFLFAGHDYQHVRRLGSYRNLLLQIVRRAIERGSHTLEMGQTCYDMKQRLGGLVRPLVFFLKHRQMLLNPVLAVFYPLLFPEVPYERRNVFRKTPRFKSRRQDELARFRRAATAPLRQRSELDATVERGSAEIPEPEVQPVLPTR